MDKDAGAISQRRRRRGQHAGVEQGHEQQQVDRQRTAACDNIAHIGVAAEIDQKRRHGQAA